MQKWYKWLEEVKKKDEKDKGGNASAQGGANEECGGECGSLAQNHLAYNMEGRGADLGE